MPRTAKIDRKTNETQIRLELNLDGSGQASIKTGVGFLDHMTPSSVGRYCVTPSARPRGTTVTL